MVSPMVVIDASLAIKTILPNPEMAHCQLVLAQLQEAQLVAPDLWAYEVTSTLAKAVFFKQITPDEGRAALQHVMRLDVQMVAPGESESKLAFEWTLRLKRASAYDSLYLSLAEELNADLWTADQRLINAFQGERPAWLHWSGETA